MRKTVAMGPSPGVPHAVLPTRENPGAPLGAPQGQVSANLAVRQKALRRWASLVQYG